MSELALCRMCARPAAGLEPLFTRPEPERYKPYALALKLATGLQIEMNDGLPQYICTECSLEVSRVLQFRAISQKAQTRFLKLGYKKNNMNDRVSEPMLTTMKKELVGQEKHFDSDESLDIDYEDDYDDLNSFVNVGNVGYIAKSNINNRIREPLSPTIKKELVFQRKNFDSGGLVKMDHDDYDFNSFSKVGTLGHTAETKIYDRVCEPLSTTMKKELEVQSKHFDSVEILVKRDHDEYDFNSFAKVGNLGYIAKTNIHDHLSDLLPTMMKKELVWQRKTLNENLVKRDNEDDFNSFAKVGNLGHISKTYIHDPVSEPLSTTMIKELVVQEENLDSDKSLDTRDHDEEDYTSFAKKNIFNDGERLNCKSNKIRMIEVNLHEFRLRLDKYLDTSAPLYTCKACKKIYKNERSFGKHTVIHTGLECMCDRCGKVLSNTAMLLRHQRAIHGAARDIRLRCPHCKYHAIDKESLKKHIRIHTGERPYICDACGTSFTGRTLLIQHLSVHMMERNVRCKECPATFKTRHGLSTHRYRSHKPRRWSYQCVYCLKMFVKSDKCRTHMRKFHGIPNDQQEKHIRVPFTL